MRMPGRPQCLFFIGILALLPTANAECLNTTTTDRIDAAVAKYFELGMDDATWVLTSAFVILTMQSGFGSLESGAVDKKFEVNVMMKNVIDVVFGGLSYWMIGYGISFGDSWHGFVGVNKFFVNVVPKPREQVEADPNNFVDMFSHYMFQFTFASTATTIVSGCVAGRMKFTTYMIFSFVNTILYAFPCHWAWASDGNDETNGDGWLYQLGYMDFAGDGPVHLMGGVNGLVGAFLVGPRPGRFDPNRKDEFGLQNPLSCIFGLFMLWWGWLGFNCGSTYGVSDEKWLIAARVAVTTINASVGGGVFGVLWSFFWRHPRMVDVESVINGILAALVGITGGCNAVSPISALIIGIIGAALCLWVNEALHRFGICDDPVGAFGVHGVAAMWGLIALGFMADNTLVGLGPSVHNGLVNGGNLELLGIQTLGVLAITVWTAVTSWFCFKVLDYTMGLRATNKEIEEGFDTAEHGVSQPDWVAELEANSNMEEHLPAMAKQIESLRVEVLEARSSFEAQQWELEALRHKHDCGVGREDQFNAFVEETDVN